MNKLQTIKEIVRERQDETIRFDEPVIIRKHHVSLMECWAIAVHENLWLMDQLMEWHKLEESDMNAGLVISSIYQRMKMLQKLKAA